MDIKSQLEKEKMDQMLKYEAIITERDTKIKSKILDICKIYTIYSST